MKRNGIPWTYNSETPLERVCSRSGHDFRLVSYIPSEKGDNDVTIQCKACGLVLTGYVHETREIFKALAKNL
jgi:hypothetical protein